MAATKPKTVRLTVGGKPVLIDVDSWALEYGTEATTKAVREDASAYLHNMVVEHFRSVLVLAEEA